MHIWVDADACPGIIKDILFRAAQRTRLPLTLVANQIMRTPPFPNIRMIQVPGGFDEADHYIVAQLQPGDLVITSDIPLAADAVAKKARVLSFRGEPYTPENIREALSMRNFMDTLRSSGVDTGGPAAFSASDRNTFARQLDRLLSSVPHPPATRPPTA